MLAIERSTPSDLPKVINFSDPDIETGAVIRSFLDICLHQEYHVLDNKIASAIVDFAQKYEFNIELERIELYLLRRLLTNSQCGYKYQFLAVALGNWQLVGLCIVFLSNNPSIEDQAILDGRAAMRRAIDFRTHDLTSFQDIYRFGPKFTMAMVKASDQSRKTSSVDYQSMGKLFVEMMVANGKCILMSESIES
jgi:hypothetical protein